MLHHNPSVKALSLQTVHLRETQTDVKTSASEQIFACCDQLNACTQALKDSFRLQGLLIALPLSTELENRC